MPFICGFRASLVIFAYMLMIRFQRIGRTGDPAFRISVLEKARAAQAGNVVERLGTYNPKTKALILNEESVKAWIEKGAQPTDSIRNLLISKGIIAGKKVNVLPKKSPIKSEAAIAAEKAAAEAAAAEAAAAAAPAPEETPVEAPTEAEVEAEAVPAEEPAAEAPAENAEEAPAEEASAAA